MEKDSLDPQSAIRDIELIKTILTESGRENEIKLVGKPIAYRTQLIVQSVVFATVVGLIICEMFTNNVNTEFLLASANNIIILQVGILNLGLTILIGLVALYYIVFLAARETNASFQEYAVQHFNYLSNFSFLADLLVKFIVVSLLLLAKKPEWIAAVLTLFTADYLFQRRFFVIELRVSLILGVLCLIFATLQFQFQLPELQWSLMIFSAIAGYSLLRVANMYKTSRG